MNTDREKIAARIQALLAKTVENGCTEAEALAAAELAGKLMDQYALSLSDVELRGEEVLRHEIVAGKKRGDSLAFVCNALAEYAGCKAWQATVKGAAPRYVFFGLRSDTQLAEYLFRVIGQALESEWVRYCTATYVADKRTARRAFELGMIDRIAKRLRALAAERREAVRASTGRDLVVVKGAVVEAAFRALSLRMRTSRTSTSIRNADAFQAGRAAGDNVGLHNGLNRSGATGPALIAAR